MGRVAYESMAGYFPTATDHPYADLLSSTPFTSGLQLEYRRHR